MKLITYNILHGGVDERGSRLPIIETVAKELNPDFLALQEAACFEENNYEQLRRMGEQTGCAYQAISFGSGRQSKNGKKEHVVSLSKLTMKQINDFQLKFRNAALETVIDSAIGEISICNAHLNPHTEEERLAEIDLILNAQSAYKYKIVVGDMNSLSPHDKYDAEMINRFNEKQLAKFTEEGKLRFDAISKFKRAGYVDAAYLAGINAVNTVPTKLNIDPDHELPLRLDYVLVSELLAPHVKRVLVVKNQNTEKGSDHYPVLAEFDF